MSDQGFSEVGPDGRLECAIEALHERRFVIAVRHKMMHLFTLQKTLHLLIQQLLSCICLESTRLPCLGILKELLEGGENLRP